MLTIHDCVQKVYNCTKITEEMVANISNRFLKKNPKEIKMTKMREREREIGRRSDMEMLLNLKTFSNILKVVQANGINVAEFVGRFVFAEHNTVSYFPFCESLS